MSETAREVRLSLYAKEAVALSHNLPNNARSVDWISPGRDALITLRPTRLRASLSKKAFENYKAFSVDQRHRLEYATLLAMGEIGKTTSWDGMQVMVNHVPLLFTRNNMVRGYRNERDSLLLASDKLHDERQRHVLIGGLATILYYTDYPNALETVE